MLIVINSTYYSEFNNWTPETSSVLGWSSSGQRSSLYLQSTSSQKRPFKELHTEAVITHQPHHRLWRVSGRSLGGLWKVLMGFRGSLEGRWRFQRVFGGFGGSLEGLEGLWRIWRVSGGCFEGLWRVFWGFGGSLEGLEGLEGLLRVWVSSNWQPLVQMIEQIVGD